MPSIFSKFFRRKKAKKGVVILDPEASTPPSVYMTAPSSPLASPVAGSASPFISIPQAVVQNISNAQAPPEYDTLTLRPDSSPALLADSPSTATTNDVPLHLTTGQQKFRAEVINTNEAGRGTVQVYEGRQQFFADVTNNNVATSNSNNSDYGNTNSTITGDAFIHCAADGTEIQISQRTTPNTLSPDTPAGTIAPQALASAPSSPPGPTQQIVGSQVFHAAMTNNNTLASGTAQVIDGDQEFWGPVVNNNSRIINSNNANANNVNSTITGNTYRVRESAQSAPAVDLADLGSMLRHIAANQHGTTPTNQARYLTNFSGQAAAASFPNTSASASQEEQMNREQFPMDNP
ncbi:hypothetical protein BJ912DRAFT_922468 [Pholiota molesta]|nr:hypothetical protein BJ912DRAFT_922468 [Pholiota molesta]